MANAGSALICAPRVMSVVVKICGVTTPRDAELVVEAGADMVGLNFVPSSKRYIDVAQARSIVAAIAGRIETVAVVADRNVDELKDLRDATGVDTLQLHGDEAPQSLESLPPRDFKAVRIATAADVEFAARFRGPRLLVDAKVVDEKGATLLGGTGHRFDWTLITDLVAQRELILAGGLNPSNVATAVSSVRPWGVDVASGVEASARVKDPNLVERFVRAAKLS